MNISLNKPDKSPAHMKLIVYWRVIDDKGLHRYLVALVVTSANKTKNAACGITKMRVLFCIRTL